MINPGKVRNLSSLPSMVSGNSDLLEGHKVPNPDAVDACKVLD